MVYIIALLQTTVSRKKGRINETNYMYSIISPPIFVAKPNQQKGGGGIISSEYSNICVPSVHANKKICVCGQAVLL